MPSVQTPAGYTEFAYRRALTALGFDLFSAP